MPGSSIYFRIALILIALPMTNPRTAGDQEPAPWLPAEALLSKLSDETPIEGYRLRIPRGYTLQTQAGPPGAIAHAWVGPARADGTRPYVMLSIGSPPLVEATRYTLRQALAKALASVEQRRKDWKQSDPEEGTIDGLKFMRAYWTGAEAQTGRQMPGFNYAAIDRERVIYLASQDLPPHHKEALQLAEAAVLTFKRATRVRMEKPRRRSRTGATASSARGGTGRVKANVAGDPSPRLT